MAHDYPPVHTVAVRRVVAFAKFLPGYGYAPLVLTARTQGSCREDEERSVFRAVDPLGVLKRMYRRYRMRRAGTDVDPHAALLPHNSWQTALLTPDQEIGWYPHAVHVGMRVLRERPVSCLFSTSPPETNHLVALRLKRKTGLPWVADFRDGWMFEPIVRGRTALRPRRHIEQRLERSVVMAADRIVTVNEVLAADLAHRYPPAADMIAVITNGYDPEDFAGLHPHARSRTFRIVYTGTFPASGGGRSIRGFLAALASIKEKQLSLVQDLEVILVGAMAPPDVEAIRALGLTEHVILTGYVPYREALQHQLDADVLLLVTAPDATGESTTKLYEYLATGLPILALTGQSTAERIVRAQDAGTIVDPTNVEGIEAAIQDYHARWQAGVLQPRPPESSRQYDRRILTGDLARILDDLVARGEP